MISNEIKPRTKDDLAQLLKLVTEAKSLEEAKAHLPVPVLHYIEEQMKETQQTYEKLSIEIKECLKNMKDIKLYISFQPSEYFLEKILQKLSLSETDRYVDVICEESIIGGSKVVVDGHVFDQSLETLIEKSLLGKEQPPHYARNV